jgi:hypothetical protein
MPCDRKMKECNPKSKQPELAGLRGWIIEDVWISKYRSWEPHLQAIKHENGDLSLRYCYYKKEGKKRIWVPMPSFAYEWTIDDFRREIKHTKAVVVEALLKRFIGI